MARDDWPFLDTVNPTLSQSFLETLALLAAQRLPSSRPMPFPPLIQQPHLLLKAADFTILLVLDLLGFEEKPCPVRDLVGEER